MKAAVLHAPHDLRIEERAKPSSIPDGHVLVKVEAVGVCGSEVHYYEEGRIGSHVLDGPMVLGHEVGGTVVQTGPNVDPSLTPGTVVALEPGIPCGKCMYCRLGQYNFCPDIRFFATPPINGAMQEYVTHPAAYTFSAEGLTPPEAALAEPLSVGVYAATLLDIQEGDRALVVGGGAVGLLAALAAQSKGGEVRVAEIDDKRAALGRQMGLDVVAPDNIDTKTGYACVMECTGSASGTQLAFNAVQTHGRIAVVGLGTEDNMRLNGLDISLRGLRVFGVFRYAHTFPTALNMLRALRRPVQPLLSHQIDIDATPEFFRASQHRDYLKTVVTLS